LVMEIKPDHVESRLTMGVVKEHRGNLDEALKWYRDAIDTCRNNWLKYAASRNLDPADDHGLASTPNGLFNEARVLEKLSRTDEAVAVYQQLLAIPTQDLYGLSA